MVSFRRLVMALVLLVIVAGIALAATTPSAPVVICSSYNQQTARLRQESKTELVPPVTFSCTVYNQLTNEGLPVQAGTIYDWEVFFPINAPLTSSPTPIGDLYEPQLTVQVDAYGSTTPEDCEMAGIALGESLYTAPYPPDPTTNGGIYPGNGTSGGAVIFAQVNMNPCGDHSTSAAPDTVYITITGLRVSAILLASNPPNYGGPLQLTFWAKPSQTKNAINLSNPGNVFIPQVNGVNQPTIVLTLGYAAPSLTVSENGSFEWRQCFAWTQTGEEQDEFFGVFFTELYSYAFAPPVDGWETNVVPPHGVNPTGDGGTRLFFQFSNTGDDAWPSFVDLQVPNAVEVATTSSVIVEAILVTGTNPDGSGGTRLGLPSHCWDYTDDLVPSAPSTDFYSSCGQWTDVTGQSLIVYEILPGATPAVTTTLVIPVEGYIISTPTIYPPPDDPSAKVTIVLAGYAPFDDPSLYDTVLPSPIPRFATPGPFSGINLLVIDACITNLLYPYLVAGGGWDTGVAVANTGLDPFGYFSPYGRFVADVPGISGVYNDQPGICNFYFYGTFNDGPPMYTDSNNPPTPVVLGAHGFKTLVSGAYVYTATGADPGDYIYPGTTAEDMIMAVLALDFPGQVPPLPNSAWNGYAIAQCDFLYAHGFAFGATKGIGGQPMSFGYLALVFDQRGIEHPTQTPEKMTF